MDNRLVIPFLLLNVVGVAFGTTPSPCEGGDETSCLAASAVDANAQLQVGGKRVLGKGAKPNIILFLVDDLGYNDLGFHQNKPNPANPEGLDTTTGGVTVKSPNIDRIVGEEAVILNNYYVQCLCTPTRATLMSGRYPFHTGLGPGVIKQGQSIGLPGDETVMAETMRDAGYATHMIGKWHLGDLDERWTPTFRGYDSFLGYLLGKGEYFQHTDKAALDFRKSSLNSANVLAAQTNEYKGVYSSLVYAERVQEIVDNRDDRPIFIYYSPNSVHSMYTGAPQSDLDKFTGPNFEGEDGDRRRVGYGMVAALDEMIGALETTFKNAGLWENTVLCFTTDNGGNPEGGIKHPGITSSGVWPGGSSFPLRGHKSTDYEGGVRGIGFIRGAPASMPLEAGTSDALFHVSDWYPTIVRMGGGSYGGKLPLDGVDQFDTIFKGASAARNTVVHNCPFREDGESMEAAAQKHGYSAALRKGDFKILYANDHHGYIPTHQHQDVMIGFGSDSPLMCEAPEAFEGKYLFNIVKDPRECTNLAGLAEHKALMDELIAGLEECSHSALPDLSIGADENKPLWQSGLDNARAMDEEMGLRVWVEWDCKAAHPDENCGWPVR